MLGEIRHIVRAWLMAELDVCTPDFEEPAERAPSPSPSPKAPHELALDWLEGAWKSHVEEPKGQGWERIDDLIRGELGLGWTTADAKNWTPGARYNKNGMFAWCGATQARALGEAGLLASIRSKRVASTVRLYEFCKGTARNRSLDEILPGDVCVVTDGSKKAGEHIVMCERVEGGLVHTIEGNAKGLGPDGQIFEGIVKRTRPLPKRAGGPGRNRSTNCPISGLPQRAEIAHVYRFLAEDFTKAA